MREAELVDASCNLGQESRAVLELVSRYQCGQDGASKERTGITEPGTDARGQSAVAR